MNTQEALNIERSAQQIMQEDPVGFRRKAAQALVMYEPKECAEILVDVANLCSHTRDELHGSELLERIYQHAAWLNDHAKEEAIIYARKERELAEINKTIFFPEGAQQ